MPDDRRPAPLLRIAAGVIDLLLLALVLVLPTTLVSWGVVWMFEAGRVINLLWWGALLILILAFLMRDGWRGRSPGKRLFGLRITTTRGRDCGPLRSVVRNIPLVVPLWNLVELWLVVDPRFHRRSGDRMAGTTVVEE